MPKSTAARLKEKFSDDPDVLGHSYEESVSEGQKALERQRRAYQANLPGEKARQIIEERDQITFGKGAEVAGAIAGSLLFGRLKLVGTLAKAGLRGANLIARATGAGLGSFIGSEITAPSEETPTEKFFRRAEAGFLGAGGEFVGAGIAAAAKPAARLTAQLPGVRTVLAPFRKTLEEGAEQAFETISEEAAKHGIKTTITPGQAVASSAIDIAENIAEASLTGAGRIRAGRAASDAVAQTAIREFEEKFVTTTGREGVGQVVQDAIDGRVSQVAKQAQKLYKRADKLRAEAIGPDGDPNIVDLRPLKRHVKTLVERFDKGLGNPRFSKIAQKILAKNDFVDFETAQILRTDLMDPEEAFKQVAGSKIPKRAMAASRLLASILTRTMRSAGESLNPEARVAFDAANEIWGKELRGELSSSLLKRVMKQDADAVLDTILQANRPGRIRTIRSILEKQDPRAWEEVQGSFIKRALDYSADEQGIVSGKKLLKFFSDRRGGFGLDAAKQILNPKELDRVRQLANAASFAQKRAGGNRSGSMLIQLTQPAAATGLAGAMIALDTSTLSAVGAGGAILVGPNALAHILTSESTARWLSVGLKAVPGTDLASRAAAQLLIRMREEKIPFEYVEGDSP